MQGTDPHAFAVTTNLADVVPQDTGAPASTFNFGNLPSSATYLFQLKNTGNVAINNVTISSDKANVAVVTPSAIAVLPTEGTSTLTPLISVQVLHGVGLNGNGASATLPAGPFTFTLTATGAGSNGTVVTSSATVTLNVQVANMEVWAGATDGPNQLPVELLKFGKPHPLEKYTFIPKWTGTWKSVDLTPSTGWWLTEKISRQAIEIKQANTRTFTIKNVGSVPVTVHSFTADFAAPTVVVIPAGESRDLQTVAYEAGVTQRSFDSANYVYADSGNVVWDSSMPAAERDGRFYFFLTFNELKNVI